MGESPMTSWMRRRGIPLAAGLVLASAAVFAVGFDGWHGYYGLSRAVVAEINPGSTGKYAGATLGPATLVEYSSGPDLTDRAPLPEDTRLLLATIPVEFETNDVVCGPAYLIESSTGREWSTSFDNGWVAPEDVVTTCNAKSASRQTLVLDFVVPVDAKGEFTIAVPLTSLTDAGVLHLDVIL